jgi:hypothetical protein
MEEKQVSGQGPPEVLKQSPDNNRLIVYALMGSVLGMLTAYVALPILGLEAPKDLIPILGTIVGGLVGVLKGSN